MVHQNIGFLLILSQVFMIYGQQEMCWEACFSVPMGEDECSDRSQFKVYNEILELILDLKLLLNTSNVTKIVYAVDASVDEHLDEVRNPEILTDPKIKYQTATRMFWYQLMLTNILSLTLGRTSYLVQYNQESSWACTGFQDATPCNFTKSLLGMMKPITDRSSRCPDNIEPACALAKQLVTFDIDSETMMIVISNNNFFSHLNKLEIHDNFCPLFPPPSKTGPTFSWCIGLFAQRYVVGVHRGKSEYFRQFGSHWSNFKRIPIGKDSYEAVSNLYRCLNPTNSMPCCVTEPTIPAAEQCFLTQGTEGEIILDYPNYFTFTDGLLGQPPSYQ